MLEEGEFGQSPPQGQEGAVKGQCTVFRVEVSLCLQGGLVGTTA